jgi:tRNA A-37 threonylcarbamoyl transferase component Bud32
VDVGEALGGRYRLVKRLGTGGMAVVWLATDEVLDRDVAVKLLSPRLAADPYQAQVMTERITTEAKAVARLSHPNIVEVFDYGELRSDVGGVQPYVVMELLAGRSLAEMLSGGALPWRVAVLICAQVAAALAAAHDNGIVHRDVTPGNVMVTAAGVKLLDFGICATAGDCDIGADNQLMGTPAYLAPERLEPGDVDPAADVYALGLLLYRALAGHAPWDAQTPMQTLRAHRDVDPQPLPSIEGLPDEITDLCLRCLDRHPALRPAAAEVAAALGSAAGVPGVPDVARATVAFASARAQVSEEDTRQLTLAPVWPRRLVVAALAVVSLGLMALLQRGDLGEPSATASARPVAAPAPAACSVGYSLLPAPAGRFTAELTVQNTGATDVGSWQLAYPLSEGEQITNVWPVTWQAADGMLTLSGGSLPAGGSAGAVIEGIGNGRPADFQLNGTACPVTLVPDKAAVVAVSATPGKNADNSAAAAKGKGHSRKN